MINSDIRMCLFLKKVVRLRSVWLSFSCIGCQIFRSFSTNFISWFNIVFLRDTSAQSLIMSRSKFRSASISKRMSSSRYSRIDV